MLGSLSVLATLALQAGNSSSSQELLQAVDSAAALAATGSSPQDYVGFNPGEPALVGGRVKSDDTLAWPIKYPTDHYAQMYFGAQKGSFAFNVIIEDSTGKQVFKSASPARTQSVSFQPKPNTEYIVVVEPSKGAKSQYSQIAGILAVVGRGIVVKPSAFSAGARKLIKESSSLLKGAGFVDSMNLFAVPLLPGTSAGAQAREAGRTQTKNTIVVVSDGRPKTFNAVLRTPDGALAGSSKNLGSAKTLKITVEANANGHPGAPLHLTNTSKSTSLFFGGIINK